MSSNSRKQLEDWLKTIKIPACSYVIDIGGSQKPVRERLGDKGEASSYIILDLKQPHEENQKVDHIMDIQDSNLDPELYNGFDVAFCLEVAEYWYNPLQALKNIWDMLKPGGVLYISFQFVYPIHNPAESDFLRYTLKGCEKLLEEAGFELADYVPREAEIMSPVMVYQAEGMKMAAGFNHDATGYLIKAVKV